MQVHQSLSTCIGGKGLPSCWMLPTRYMYIVCSVWYRQRVIKTQIKHFRSMTIFLNQIKLVWMVKSTSWIIINSSLSLLSTIYSQTTLWECYGSVLKGYVLSSVRVIWKGFQLHLDIKSITSKTFTGDVGWYMLLVKPSNTSKSVVLLNRQ